MQIVTIRDEKPSISHIPRRKNPVRADTAPVRQHLKDEKSEMGAYFRRMKSKDGYMQAIVATAHKIVRIIYTMVKTRKKNLGLKTAR